MGQPTNDVGARATAATLTEAVLAEEAARTVAQEEARRETLFADDLLPGVDSEPLTLKEGVAKGGGWGIFVVLTLLNSLDELEQAAISVLAPEIRDTFGVSDGAIVFIASASAAFIVLGAVPMGWLADRVKRTPIVGLASAFFAMMVVASGFAVNAFMLFWTRFGVGIAKSNSIPVHGSIIADAYPIGVRGRMASVKSLVERTMAALSPFLVARIAAWAGGDEGWRWSYYLLALPVGVLAIAAFTLKEPPRGQFEKDDVLDGDLGEDDDDAPPIAMAAAFERLKKIRTVRSVMLAFSALGFSLFGTRALLNLFIEDEYGLDTTARGDYQTIAGLITMAILLPMLPWWGRYFDNLYRTDPPRALVTIGALLLPQVLLVPIGWLMPNAVLFFAFEIATSIFSIAVFAMVGPVINAVVPYRLRGLGSSLITIYIFFIGAVGGGLISFFLVNSFGPRVAVITLVMPSALFGGLILINSARFIRNDLSLVVEELLEEQDEATRRSTDPDNIPVLQVANLDYSYGPVQVLFDVGFEVRRGETLALLGTNGAGKSTVFRAISGLGTSDRGVVRLNGQTITYTAAEMRTEMGIIQVAGGKATFPPLTVRDNLMAGGWIYRHDSADLKRRIDHVLELFPSLAERLDVRAGDLSGGQQQMLALAKALLHEPEVLLIDELSLGLAPLVVQELLEIVETLQERGQTMVIIEQSINLALSVSDRAIFMEKGQVRFEGPASELAERDDLVRAVFFGQEGG